MRVELNIVMIFVVSHLKSLDPFSNQMNEAGGLWDCFSFFVLVY